MNNFAQQGNNQGQQFNWEDCYKTAQLVPLPDLGFVCSPAVKRLVSNHANAIGCPQEYLFLPLLSCCAGLMGNKSKIKVNQTWTEPCIVWTMVGARAGTRKSSALKQLMVPLLDIQREQERHWHLSQPTSSGTPPESCPPKLITGPMCLRDICQVMKKNNGQILCISEDIEYFHKTFGGHGLQQKERMHCLYEGMPHFEVQEGELSILDSTCFNHTGMASPEYVVNLHLNNPATWLCSRYLVACAPNPNFATIWNSNPMSADTPSIKKVFQTLHTYHQQFREYVFSDDAWKELTRCHDEEWASIVSQLDHDEKRRAVIEKSLGQIVRVSGILKALINACEFTKQTSEPSSQSFQWDLVIDKETLRKGIDLNKYFVEQKLALMLMSGFNLGVSYYRLTNASRLVQQPTGGTTAPVAAQSSMNEEWSENNYENGAAEQSFADDQDDGMGEERIAASADFMSLDKQQFVAAYGKRIRRLLECYDDGHGVSATTASQKSITPPVRVPGTNNRHPVWASALFFQKTEEIGIGTAEQVKHPTNRKFYWRFKRCRPNELTDKNKQLLHYLKVDMSQYNRIGPNIPIMQPPVSPGKPDMPSISIDLATGDMYSLGPNSNTTASPDSKVSKIKEEPEEDAELL